ncbi:MAG: hypothetical protein H6979_09675 [Chromatiales bacterium]|nr:hypothetical protein [Chromatiales bacterium]
MSNRIDLMDRCRARCAALASAGIAILALAGCAATPKIPEAALRLPETTIDIRTMQSHSFAVPSETIILAAAVAVLQDMEYNLDDVEKPLGVLSASKVSDADSKSEKTGLFMLDVLCAAGGTSCNYSANASDKQKITVTLVVLPSLARKGEFVARVTIQRVVFNKMQQVTLTEPVVDAKTYQDIFDKLSQSIFLQVNKL